MTKFLVEEFILTLNGKLLPSEMLELGNYEDVTGLDADQITGAFEPGNIEIIKTRLCGFKRKYRTQEKRAKLHLNGFRPANIRELLSLGIEYPDAQKRFSIVALGSEISGNMGTPKFPFLGIRRGKRCFGYEYDRDLAEPVRLLIVPQSDQPELP